MGQESLTPTILANSYSSTVLLVFFQPRDSKSVFAVCSSDITHRAISAKKQMALGERMLFGVVGNILKPTVSLNLLFLIRTLVLPRGVRECNFSLTPRYFICLDP